MTTRSKAPQPLNGFAPRDGGPIMRAAWRSFREVMRDYQYGENETRDAWGWFLNGWEAHIHGPRHGTK